MFHPNQTRESNHGTQSKSPSHRACLTTAYLAHLFHAQELLAYRLATVHNLRFYQRLVAQMRQAVLEGGFDAFRQRFHAAYTPADGEVRQEQRQRLRQRRGGTGAEVEE